MGRPKGGTNKEWSIEEKKRVSLRVINGEGSIREIAREEGIHRANVGKWAKAYAELGIKGITSKKKPGNPLIKFQFKKNLTELEKLQYENMKLRIENERLKKGYTNEEAMSIRQKK
jgi:transposase-like protein